jgi:hypothetical protein
MGEIGRICELGFYRRDWKRARITVLWENLGEKDGREHKLGIYGEDWKRARIRVLWERFEEWKN